MCLICFIEINFKTNRIVQKRIFFYPFLVNTQISSLYLVRLGKKTRSDEFISRAAIL